MDSGGTSRRLSNIMRPTSEEKTKTWFSSAGGVAGAAAGLGTAGGAEAEAGAGVGIGAGGVEVTQETEGRFCSSVNKTSRILS